MKKIILAAAILLYSAAGFSTTLTVTNVSMTFNPSNITITAGDSVMFNLQSIHNAVEVSQATWNANGTTPLPGGFTVPFGGGLVLPSHLTAGVHYYVCQAHASFGMKGKITVTPAAVSTVVFQKDYGTADSLSDASGASGQQTMDGGYITAGYISNFGAGDDDIYLVKTNANGDITWTKTYGGSSGDDANAVIQTADSGYAITGVTVSFGGENIFLVKTNASGDTLWSKIYGTGDTLSDASASSLQQTADGGYVMTGYISNFGAGSDDFYLVKTDANGNLLWTKTYGGINNDDAASAQQTSDGGYIIAGTSSSFADTLGDVYLIKTDATGDTLWTKSYGSNLTDAMDMGNAVQQTSDHGYIIAGVTVSASQGENALLIKTDSAGTIQWTRLYGTGDASSDASLSSVQQTTDGGYIAAGYISNFGAGSDDYYLIKTDSNGDTLWTKTYGSTSVDDANFVKQTTDGGYIAGGVTVGFAAGGEHLYLVKVDSVGHASCNEYNTQTTNNSSISVNTYGTTTQVSTGGVAGSGVMTVSSGGTATDLCIGAGINELSDNSGLGITVYPNPFSDEATVIINTSSVNLHNSSIVMYDLFGNQVQKINSENEYQFKIASNNLESGIYFLQVQSGEKTYNQKIIIAK